MINNGQFDTKNLKDNQFTYATAGAGIMLFDDHFLDVSLKYRALKEIKSKNKAFIDLPSGLRVSIAFRPQM